MICHFDFYAITAESRTLRPLIAAGIPRAKIEHRFSHWETYGRTRYRRYKYVAALGYVDAHTSTTEEQILAIVAKWKPYGIKVYSTFIAVD